MLSNLSIWTNTPDLPWYRQVADNERPAKFLIARRIGIPANYRELTTEELWQIHQEAADQLRQWKQQIMQDPKIYDQLLTTSPSLLDLNVELVDRMLKSCTFCQWHCQVDRSGIDLDPALKTGACQLGEESRVGSFFHHRGEELIYRGQHGSGTIFFTSCNMRCQFCQNGNISQDKYNGQITSETDLAAIIWLLRIEGCHNINLVGGDPTIHLHTIIRAIAQLQLDGPPLEQIRKVMQIKSDGFIDYPAATKHGSYRNEFNAPILWNANFFMSEEAMQILGTVIDIWLPDFKFGPDKKCATRLARTPWYWDTVTRNLKQIYDWQEEFTIRHLVMPNHVQCCTDPILQWIGENLPGIQVNIMDQYHPDSFTNPTSDKYKPRMKDISRRLTRKEFQNALQLADQYHIDYQTISFS